MPDGTIKTITDRDFGFIQPDKGRDDVFFHRSALVDVSIEQLHQGDHVTFIVADGAREGSERVGRARHQRLVLLQEEEMTMVRSMQPHAGTPNTLAAQLAETVAEKVADAMDQAGLALTLTNTMALTSALGKALERIACERAYATRQDRLERRAEWVRERGLLTAADMAQQLGLTAQELETAQELGIIAPVDVPLDLRATSDHFTRESWCYYLPDSALTAADRARIAHDTLLTRMQAAQRLGVPPLTFDHLRVEHDLIPVEHIDGAHGHGNAQPNLYRADAVDELAGAARQSEVMRRASRGRERPA